MAEKGVEEQVLAMERLRKRKEVSQFANTSAPFNSIYFFLTQPMLKVKFLFSLKITAYKGFFVQ